MRSVSFDLKTYSRTFSVSKPIDEVFNVLNDVEDYQSFIPFCSESKIIEQTETVIKASLVLSFLNTSSEFISENRFKKNEREDMSRANKIGIRVPGLAIANLETTQSPTSSSNGNSPRSKRSSSRSPTNNVVEVNQKL